MILKTDTYKWNMIEPHNGTDISPFDHGSLTVLAARPGMGTTSLGAQITMELARKSGKEALILSLEEGAVSFYERMLGILAPVAATSFQSRLFSPKEEALLEAASNRLKEMKITVEDAPLTEKQLLDRLERVEACGIVLIDLSSELQKNLSSVFFSSLRYLARRKGLPILVSLKLDRSLEKRRNKKPTVKDLKHTCKDTWGIDRYFLLYREAYYTVGDVLQEAELIYGEPEGTPQTVSLEWNSLCRYFSKKE